MEDTGCPNEGSRHGRGFGHRRATVPAASACGKGSMRASEQHRLPLMTGWPANYRRQEIKHANKALSIRPTRGSREVSCGAGPVPEAWRRHPVLPCPGGCGGTCGGHEGGDTGQRASHPPVGKCCAGKAGNRKAGMDRDSLGGCRPP